MSLDHHVAGVANAERDFEQVAARNGGLGVADVFQGDAGLRHVLDPAHGIENHLAFRAQRLTGEVGQMNLNRLAVVRQCAAGDFNPFGGGLLAHGFLADLGAILPNRITGALGGVEIAAVLGNVNVDAVVARRQIFLAPHAAVGAFGGVIGAKCIENMAAIATRRIKPLRV